MVYLSLREEDLSSVARRLLRNRDQVEVERVACESFGEEDRLRRLSMLAREESILITTTATRGRRSGIKGRPGSKGGLPHQEEESAKDKSWKDLSSKDVMSGRTSKEFHVEHHVIIQTVSEGFNLGRRHVHRDETDLLLNKETCSCLSLSII